jgi:hypothetical protein
MLKGIFRTSNGWVQVDYGAHSAPIPRYQYEADGFQPPFDNLPFEADYRAAEKKAQDNAKGVLEAKTAQPNRLSLWLPTLWLPTRADGGTICFSASLPTYFVVGW